MNGTVEVCLTLTEGPICGLGDARIEASYPLWDSIIAAESFPPGAGASGANYVLRLKKEVSHASEVRPAEDGLTKALQMLAAAWPFSGGSSLIIETREVVCSPRVENNANDLEREMSAPSGLTRVVPEVRMPLGWSATYSQAPLCLAARIARLMHSDPDIRRLLFYHQKSVIERAQDASWFISLFQIRDFFSQKYEKDEVARKILGITPRKWRYFGTKLGPLRHACGSAQSVSNDDLNKLYALALSWVASYLRIKGIIPALPSV
jgi:hypothetical protein